MQIIRYLTWAFRLNFIGGIIDAISGIEDKRYKRSKAKSSEFLRSYDLHMDNTKYQRAVVDAKQAGLHPLFALGASGFTAPPTAAFNTTTAGQEAPYQGGRLGGAIDKMVLGKERKQRQSGMDVRLQAMEAAQIRNLDSRSSLNEINAMRLSSDDAMNQRDPWDTGTLRGTPGGSDFEAIGVGPPDARTFPIGTRPRSLDKRPLTMESNRSVPMRMDVRLDDGSFIRVIGQNWDEVSQADLLYQLAIHYASRGMTTAAAGRKAKSERRRLNRIKRQTRTSNRRYRVEQRTWRGRK